MTLVRRIRSLESSHAWALTGCWLCGGPRAGQPRIVRGLPDRPFNRCPRCDHAIDGNGDVIPASSVIVRRGVRAFTRN